MKICIAAIFLYFIVNLVLSKDSGCPKNYECIPQGSCKNITSKTLVFPCIKDDVQLLCCPTEDYVKPMLVSKSNIFPDNCGNFALDDRVMGGEKANLGEFPFMALLGYTQKNIPFTQYLCGGTIITDRYILTAGHCIKLNAALSMTTVRLGEHDLTTKVDCVQIGEDKDCADEPIDIDVEMTITHPKFDSATIKNDIALVKVKKAIKFSDFIRPICLPFEKGLQTKSLEGSTFQVAGWGKYKPTSSDGSPALLHAKVSVWNLFQCNSLVPQESRPIQNTQLCANGKKSRDACKGDSGGPLFNKTIEGKVAKTYQIGIVSFGVSQACGDIESPTVYTRVDGFLTWIKENVK